MASHDFCTNMSCKTCGNDPESRKREAAVEDIREMNEFIRLASKMMLMTQPHEAEFKAVITLAKAHVAGIQAQLEKATLEALKKKALAKLTDEERKALGL